MYSRRIALTSQPWLAHNVSGICRHAVKLVRDYIRLLCVSTAHLVIFLHGPVDGYSCAACGLAYVNRRHHGIFLFVIDTGLSIELLFIFL